MAWRWRSGGGGGSSSSSSSSSSKGNSGCVSQASGGSLSVTAAYGVAATSPYSAKQGIVRPAFRPASQSKASVPLLVLYKVISPAGASTCCTRLHAHSSADCIHSCRGH
jgi:hypothetical protein